MNITLSVDLQQNKSPYEGMLIIEDGGRVFKTTITANSHDQLQQDGKLIAEQFRNGGLIEEGS